MVVKWNPTEPSNWRAAEELAGWLARRGRIAIGGVDTRRLTRAIRQQGAPHVALIHAPADLGPYGAMDSGGFVTAFTLAATALGIATVPQAAIAAYAPQVRDHFGIADDRLLLCAISFGYADEDNPANHFRTERAEPEEIIDWQEA